MSNPTQFLALDEEGYALNGDVRWVNEEAGRAVLESLRFHENGALVSEVGGVPVFIEAFDEPLVAAQIDREGSEWSLLFPYDHRESFEPATLRLDEWDRFHGLTSRGIPFVLSRRAQAAFFDLLDDYDDESITIGGETILVPPLLSAESEINKSNYWTQIYHEEKNPRWNLGEAAEVLKDMLPRLRLPKARIMVAGCGEGHDAAFFAKEGHVVTAIDFSEEAIARAKAQYGHLSNLQFLQADAFKLGPEHDGAYDLVFEHTLYCAIDPSRRNDLTKAWSKWLAPNGTFLGVFFTMTKPAGPPFGATEWEIRERLRRNYRFLFWARWRKSIAGRQGKELFVYASKLAST